MKIVLTNDDGVDAPGLKALRGALSTVGEMISIAPLLPLSGCSHQVTTDRPLRLVSHPENCYSLDGTSADCTRIALLSVAPDAEWVFSGINDGGNLGVDTFMSGTVAAAREAALLGKRAIAISQYRRRQMPFDWAWTEKLAEHVLKQLIRRPLPARCFWNVNLPAEYENATTHPDLVFCPLDPNPLPVTYEMIEGAYHYRSNYQSRQKRLGADVDICFSGRVAISLVSIDPA
jgi:5'-nucleotidase